VEPVELDEALPDLGGGPPGLPLPGELAGRVAAAEPHGALQEPRAVGAPERQHRRLPRDRRARLHRRPRRARPPRGHRHVHRPADRRDPRRRAHRRRPAALLSPLVRRRRLERLGADQAGDQGPTGRSRRLPAPALPLLAGRQGSARAAAVASARTGLVIASEPGDREVRLDRARVQRLPQRRVGTGAAVEGEAFRCAAALVDERQRQQVGRGALHAESADARDRARLRRLALRRHLPARRVRRLRVRDGAWRGCIRVAHQPPVCRPDRPRGLRRALQRSGATQPRDRRQRNGHAPADARAGGLRARRAAALGAARAAVGPGPGPGARPRSAGWPRWRPTPERSRSRSRR
jgi:hypothetical protein